MSCHCEGPLEPEAISGSWVAIGWAFQKYGKRDCFEKASSFLAMTGKRRSLHRTMWW